MARITTKIEPLDKDIAILLREDLSPQARSKAFAAFARDTIDDTDRANAQAAKRKLNYATWVDGAKTDRLESVKPDGGVIVAEWEILTDSFEWIDEQLILHSPFRTGRYAKSHKFYADGVEADPARPPFADEYWFVNTQPYARKIERGLSSQSPEGVYQVVAVLAGQRFSNSARVRYAFRDYGGERQPAIVIRPR